MKPTRDEVRDYLHARLNTTAINLLDATTGNTAELLNDFTTAVAELRRFAMDDVITFDILSEVERWRAEALGDDPDVARMR